MNTLKPTFRRVSPTFVSTGLLLITLSAAIQPFLCLTLLWLCAAQDFQSLWGVSKYLFRSFLILSATKTLFSELAPCLT